MKKLIFFILAITGTITALAQSTDNWRLTKKSYKGPDWTETVTYSYSSKWQLKEVRQVQNNKLVQVLNNFIRNSNEKTIGYQEINIGVNSTKTFTLSYDVQERLQEKTVQYFKDGKENFKTITTFSYAANKVTATKEIITKNGNATIVSEYQLDEKGNVLMSIGDLKSSGTYINYKNYDNTKNPLLFTGSLIDKDLLSPNNPGKVLFSGSSKLDFVVKKNASNLVTAIEEHFDNGSYKIINGSTYTYVAIKK
jgi:hypothetical protein